MSSSSSADIELSAQLQHLDDGATPPPPADIGAACYRFNDLDSFSIVDEEDTDEALMSDAFAGPTAAAAVAATDTIDSCCCHQLPPPLHQHRRGCAANSLSSLATTCSTSSCSSTSAWEDNAGAAAASAVKAADEPEEEAAAKAMDLQQQLRSSMRSLQLGQLLAPAAAAACQKSGISGSVHRDSRQLRLVGRPAGVCSRRRSSAISARSKSHYLAQYKADKLGYFNAVVSGGALVREQQHRRMELNSWR